MLDLGGIVFDRPIGLLLGLLLPLLYGPFRYGRSPSAGLGLALGARMAAAMLVVAVVAGVSVETREPADDLCIVVAVDSSESVGPQGGESRDRLVAELLDRMRPGDLLGAVAFGRGAEVVSWPVSPPARPAFERIGVDPGATRLAAGIEASVPLCPERTARKIVLVTDGNETLGDARRAAAFARQADVRLFATVPDTEALGGIAFEKLTAPPLVREGSVFPLRLVVRNRGPEASSGAIDLLLDGEPVSRELVRIDPGVNLFEIPYQLHERGSYRLAARVAESPEDSGSRREVSLAVAGPIRALVVGEAPDPALARALRLKDVDVEFVRPGRLPGLEDLLQYHCVIVDDVPHRAFSPASLRVLESYVRNFGGGFLMTGGATSFGDKRYRKSPVERILPISFVEQKPKPKGREAMGVFLLIDRSNSMSYNSRRRDARDGEKMSYAKQAARALVAQLRPADRVGVIAFDSDPYVLGSLKPLSEHRATLEDRISRLLPGGGTDFKASLEIAAAQLAGSGLGVRHVILLTDGDTNRGAADHEPLMAALARAAITVTTIRIGEDDVNLDLLREISRQTGGRFYHVQDIERLPQLIVTDTQRLKGPDEEGAMPVPPSRYPVRMGEPSPVVQGFHESDLPDLRDVIDARLKPGADAVLYGLQGERELPLLATWQYGLGRTAAFMLDPTSTEARQWVAWDGFGKLWSQLVRWAIREETPWETRNVVRFEEGGPVLEVQTFDPNEEGTLTAQVFTDAERSVDLHLVPVAPRLFRAPLPPLAPGRYALLLTRSLDGKNIAQRRDVLQLDAALEDEGVAELARKLPDFELLHEITTEAGGSIDPNVDELTARHGATRLVRHRLDLYLIPLALALLLGDIWIRLRLER